MLADLDETVRHLLVRHVPLDLSEVDVSFAAPDREWSGRLSRPTVNCFLYDVRENLSLRETRYDINRRDGAVTGRKGPLRVDAAYHVSVWARAAEDEHQLLWRVLAALARFPLLPQDVLQGAIEDQPLPVPVRIAQPDDSPRNAGDLWSALDNRIRPSLAYVVTLALDPQVVYTSPLVLTRVVDLQDGAGHVMSESIQIGGRVRGRETPHAGVAGATVILQETGARTRTDDTGRFRFGRAPRGSITLTVRAPDRPEVNHQTAVPSPNYDLEV